MSMMKLAYMNFKNSLKSYLSLIVSLAFTILIFLNFQNIVYSNSLDVLGERNKDNIIIIVQAITVVLICFMFFFIWYSTNVFLTKQEERDWNLCIHGFDESENREIVYDRDNNDRIFGPA